jgi:hypothetical protein
MRSGRGDGHLRPPGFPIRTPSDHSLVADSPRLIAGSSVLHRLLMPRHPPCALSNLANIATDTLLRRRCSRPLCSSQDTDGTRPSPARPRRIRSQPCIKKAPATTPRKGDGRPCPQMPNSVLTWPLPRAARSGPGGRTSHRREAAGQVNSQCSTRQHEHQAARTAADGAECSLERR